MEFGWISLFGAGITVLLLIPNVLYAFGRQAEEDMQISKGVIIAEQVGRYACIMLMWLPLLVGKFAFKSPEEFLIYFIGNLLLIVLYYLFWILYSFRKKLYMALVLTIVPTVVFLLSGLLLRHWLLVFAGLLFGACHIYITYRNNCDDKK